MTQDEALTILKTGANVFLTGEAGSGKSHTVNGYVRYLREHGIAASITASTGIAATHIAGMTIHSWSGIGIKKNISPYDLDAMSSNEKLLGRVNAAKVLIIDEISMLDGAVLNGVELVCRTLRKNDEAFGGLQVVFVGDFFQLPPISRMGEDRATFCFESQAWQRANPITCYLSEQHRQEDLSYLSILTAIRRGEVEQDIVDQLIERQVEDETDQTVTKLYTHNEDVDRINTTELKKLPGKSHAFSMRHQGGSALVEGLKRGCLSPEELELREGAKVLFTKNNFEAGYVNGTLGTVKGFDPDSGNPIIETHNGLTITAVPMDWTIEDGGKVLAKISQVPLRLAWAITVHKSQGMSMDAAVINLSRAFEYGQGYVALSRVRTLKGLTLLGFNQRSLQVHPQVQDLDKDFRENSDKAVDMFNDMDQATITNMQHNFLKACGGTIEVHKTDAPKDDEPKKIGNTAYAEKLAKLREKFPNAYRPWKKEDDEKLSRLFEESKSASAISKDMGRQPGSIHMRLIKLGLIEDDGETAVIG